MREKNKRICPRCKKNIVTNTGCYCNECQRPRSKEYRKNHLEEVRRNGRNFRKRWRDKAIQVLGGKCMNPYCPIPPEKFDVRSLHIDHINGGGNKERCSTGSLREYRKVVNGEPGYQLLCAYCNWMKRFHNKEEC